MASGTIECIVKSIDYGGGIGHVTMKSYFDWNVNDSGLLTVSYVRSESISGGAQSWGICGTTPGYGIYAYAQWSTDGGNTWTNIMSAPVVEVAICPSLTNVYNTMAVCFQQFQPYTLSQSGMLRITYGANRAPAPSASLPNSFPSYVQTEDQQVPVHIDVSWDATLNYNANGGSGAPSAQTHRQSGDSYTFTIPNTVPTWEWHRFEGWSTSSTATTPSYHGGDQFTVYKSNPDRTLYAVWTEWYRVGDVRYSGTFKTTHRSGGKCHLRQNGNWVEMRSIDGGTEGNDPPSRRLNNKWLNQYKIGSA